MKEKILCIQLKQIGDVLMTTPAIRSLAEACPDAEIHILTQVPSDQIFAHNPHVSRTLLYPGSEKLSEILSLIRILRRERYSTVIDFFGLPKTALLSRLTGASRRIGFERPGRSMFYTHPVKDGSTASYSALQRAHLLSALGISGIKPELDFFVGTEDESKADGILSRLNRDQTKPLVSVSPVSRRDYKVWPAERFADLCDFLIGEYSAQILFLWGPGEYHFIEAVREKMRYAALPDYDIPSISETVALLKQVDLHIGNDNGPMHFAISTGVRTVAIFGRPLMRNWTPPGQDRHLAVEFDPGCKESCHYPKCKLECIRELEPDLPRQKVVEQMDRVVLEKEPQPRNEQNLS